MPLRNQFEMRVLAIVLCLLSLCAEARNVAPLGAIINSSGADPTTPVTNLINGITNDPLDRWSMYGLSSGPVMVEINLGAEYTLDAIKLHPYMGRTYQFRVETKGNSGDYGIVADLTSNTTGGVLSHTIAPTVARYVKLSVTGASGYTGDWVSLQELELNAVTDATVSNLARTATVVTYAGATENEPITALFDEVSGDDNNRWSVWGIECNPWVEIDLGSEYYLSSMTLDSYQNRAYQFVLDTRTADGSYVTAIDLRQNTQVGPMKAEFSEPNKARYVRLKITGVSGYDGGWVSLRELQIFGSPNPPVEEPPNPEPSADHPRGLHTPAQIKLTAEKITSNALPWVSAWANLQAYAGVRLNEVPSAVAQYGPFPFYYNGGADQASYLQQREWMQADMYAAYSTAAVFAINAELAGRIPSSDRYADKAIQILNNWATVNQSISLDEETNLAVSYVAPGLIHAAEMVWNYPGWSRASRDQFVTWAVTILKPVADKKKMRSLERTADGVYQVPNWISKPYYGNHNFWGVLCSLAIGSLTKNMTSIQEDVVLLKTLINLQIKAEGSQPQELGRGELSINYSAFALEPLSASFEILRNTTGENLYDWTASGGGSLKKGLDFVHNGIENPLLWPVVASRNNAANYAHTQELFAAMGRVYGISKWTVFRLGQPPVPDLGTGVGWPLPTLLQPAPK